MYVVKSIDVSFVAARAFQDSLGGGFDNIASLGAIDDTN